MSRHISKFFFLFSQKISKWIHKKILCFWFLKGKKRMLNQLISFMILLMIFIISWISKEWELKILAKREYFEIFDPINFFRGWLCYISRSCNIILNLKKMKLQRNWISKMRRIFSQVTIFGMCLIPNWFLFSRFWLISVFERFFESSFQ